MSGFWGGVLIAGVTFAVVLPASAVIATLAFRHDQRHGGARGLLFGLAASFPLAVALTYGVMRLAQWLGVE